MTNKKHSFSYLAFLLMLASVLASGCSKNRSEKPRVLVFTKTAGFHHQSIPTGIKAIKKLGAEHGFEVDTTKNASRFTEDSLKNYSAVIFLNTTGNVLNYRQQNSFRRYIEAGGGYMGIHAASDTEYRWPWYGKLVGAYFKSHPQIQQAVLHVHKDPKFPVTDSLPSPWIRVDEWYNWIKPPKNVHVLVSIDESSYRTAPPKVYEKMKRTSNGRGHPLVWYHNYDGGRAFYMEMGHTSESYGEPDYLALLLSGIQYAIGNNGKLDYSQVATSKVPPEGAFTKKRLAGPIDEPTEITVLPDLSVLIDERKGGIEYYNSSTGKMTQVAHLDVYHRKHSTEGRPGHPEFGLIGIQKDPHFLQNHWIYVYYSVADTTVDRLSRFKFVNGDFKMNSQQIILNVQTTRGICCHTGGSIAFGPKGNLFLAVGGNTEPFDEVNPKTGKAYPVNSHGFAPLDTRPGHEAFDAERGPGNTNDLRGSVLRIHVNKDGSYSIPKGNLFPPGTPKTRPEIYTMGHRNDYRISVDQHTGYLYIGVVGPDAGSDSLATRGPRGYDEIVQARRAANYGWPYAFGANYPYHSYNYNTGEPGPAFSLAHPENNSRNNTGLTKLPPVTKPFIWYPYAKSTKFPILGAGGRTALPGPVYYIDDYPDSTRYPTYYNGKLFIYEYMRNWIMAVTMYQHGPKKGDLKRIEPFMPHQTFHSIIDMEAGPDGRLYLVEYGDNEGWFKENTNSGLYVIDYKAPKTDGK
jgi:glucose/arabinose dehydrogenase